MWYETTYVSLLLFSLKKLYTLESNHSEYARDACNRVINYLSANLNETEDEGEEHLEGAQQGRVSVQIRQNVLVHEQRASYFIKQ